MVTKLIAATSIQEGRYIVLDDAPCKVTSIQISRPGKHGHAKIRLTGVGLFDDKKRVIVAPGHDNVEVPIVEKKTAQVLSVHGDQANVMDMDTYETFDLAIPEELKPQVVDGVQIIYWEVLADKVMKQAKAE